MGLRSAGRQLRRDRNVILTLLAVLALPGYLVGEALLEYQRRSELLSLGARTDAVVSRLWKPGSKADCRTEFRYKVDGTVFHADVPGCANQTPGKLIAIAYNPLLPTSAIPVAQGAWARDTLVGLYFFGSVVLLTLVLLCVSIAPTVAALLARKKRG